MYDLFVIAATLPFGRSVAVVAAVAALVEAKKSYLCCSISIKCHIYGKMRNHMYGKMRSHRYGKIRSHMYGKMRKCSRTTGHVR